MNDATPAGSELTPERLGLRPHPEGGWYRETWRHAQVVSTERGPRSLATAISFLLQPGEQSAWHRVASDEVWLWQGGARVRLRLGGSDAAPQAADTIELGVGDQHVVPAHTWQSAEPIGGAVLVACVVCPGFDFGDFTLAE